MALGYPIETELKTKVIRKYIDTLIQKKGYGVPEKWSKYNKLVDLDSVNNKRIYFQTGPEEMYLISFSGMLVLNDVYNPKIKDDDWVAEKNLMPSNQELRVINRFKQQILDSIKKMAIQDGLKDSDIYK